MHPAEALDKILSVFHLNKLKGLYSSLARIRSILPSALQHSISFLFIWMTLASLMELASIFALTLFFRLIYSPMFIMNLPGIPELLTKYPSLQESFQDPKIVMLWGCLFPIILIVLKNILQAVVSWKSSIVSEKVAAFAGSTIMEKYLYMPYSWHLSSQKALAVLAMQRRFQLGEMLLHTLRAYSNLITAVTLFGGLAFYAPGVTAGTVISMFILGISTYSMLKHRIDMAGDKYAKATEKENIATQTALSGVRELIIYQKQQTFIDEINKSVQASRNPRAFLNLSPTVPSWTLESGGFFLIWLTIYSMIHFSTATHAEMSETVALLALTAWRILPALNRIVGATVSLRGLRPTAMSCLDYLESLKDAKIQKDIEPDPDFKILHDIKFDNISYAYPDTKKLSLKNITCQIPMGTTIGLVGRSGAGKTTFINILSGLLAPTSGKLLIDDKEMSPAQLAAYRQQIGYVPQTPYVLGGTVAQNVAFSDWGENIDPKRVREACQEAAIDFLGENCENINRNAGGTLSGGQMQRVSIARALYVKPALLIFDEATSALDQGAEAQVQDAMLKSQGIRTNVIAAHRLETLEICDIIFWLEDGILIKSGPAKEILKIYKDALHDTLGSK